MTKKRFWVRTLLLFGMACTAILSIPSWRWAVLGTLRNEPFYEGRPISYWSGILHDKDSPASDRQTAVEAHLLAGPKAWPDLANAIERPEEDARGHVKAVVSYSPPRDTAAVPVIAALASDSWGPSVDHPLAIFVAETNLGPGRFADPELSAAARERLKGVLPNDPKGLLPYLHDPDADIRRGTAFALYCLGPKCQQALPELAAALTDEDPGVRAVITCALAASQSPAACPALFTALTDKATLVRYAAVVTLCRQGSNYQGALAGLLKAAKDPAPAIRLHAAKALGKLGPAGREAAATLASLLQEDNLIHIEAGQALQSLGPEAKEATPILVKMLKYPKDRQRRVLREGLVIECLVSIGPSTAPALVSALKDPDEEIKLRSIAALRRLGPMAKGDRWSDDQDVQVREMRNA